MEHPERQVLTTVFVAQGAVRLGSGEAPIYIVDGKECLLLEAISHAAGLKSDPVWARENFPSVLFKQQARIADFGGSDQPRWFVPIGDAPGMLERLQQMVREGVSASKKLKRKRPTFVEPSSERPELSPSGSAPASPNPVPSGEELPRPAFAAPVFAAPVFAAPVFAAPAFAAPAFAAPAFAAPAFAAPAFAAPAVAAPAVGSRPAFPSPEPFSSPAFAARPLFSFEGTNSMSAGVSMSSFAFGGTSTLSVDRSRLSQNPRNRSAPRSSYVSDARFRVRAPPFERGLNGKRRRLFVDITPNQLSALPVMQAFAY